MEKGSEDQEERTSRITGSKSHVRQKPRRTRTQEHVAGCRREETSRVSIPHHPRPVVKNEVYFMNRKKKDKLVLGKKGNVYVVDLFVRVPPSVTAPVT